VFASVVRCRCRVSHIANARVHAACLFRCRPPVYLGALVVGGWDNNRRRFGQAVSAFCLHANCVDKNSSHKCLMGSTIDSAREESCKCECLFVRAITHAANFQFSPDGRKLGWTERSRTPCMPCAAISMHALQMQIAPSALCFVGHHVLGSGCCVRLATAVAHPVAHVHCNMIRGMLGICALLAPASSRRDRLPFSTWHASISGT